MEWPSTELGKEGVEQILGMWDQQLGFGHVEFEILVTFERNVWRQVDIGADCINYLLLGNKLLKTQQLTVIIIYEPTVSVGQKSGSHLFRWAVLAWGSQPGS